MRPSGDGAAANTSSAEQWYNAKQFKNFTEAFQRAGTDPFAKQSPKGAPADVNNKDDSE